MPARNYSNTATEATLTGSITSADTSIALTSYAGFPAPPFTAAIDRGTASEEIILVTGVSGENITAAQRGYDGTSAKSHAAGAALLHVTVAKDYSEANGHTNASAGVHGVAGAVVGTTDVQTLSNKTLTSPVLAGAVSTGTHSFANGTFSGTVSVTGALTASGGVSIPAGKRITLTDAPTDATDGANKIYADARETAAKAYTDTRETAIKGYADGLVVPTASGRQLTAHWGSGPTFPTVGLRAGDTFLYTGLCLFRYNGTAWRQAETCEVATKAARDALPTAPLHAGFRVYQSDWQWEWTYSGTAWHLTGFLGTKPVWSGSAALAYSGTGGAQTVVFSGAPGRDDMHGLITVNTVTGVFTINANVRVSLAAEIYSDSGTPRWTHSVLQMPTSARSTLSVWEDFREAPAGYPSGGTLRQTVGGAVHAASGDTFTLTYASSVNTGVTSYLSATFL